MVQKVVARSDRAEQLPHPPRGLLLVPRPLGPRARGRLLEPRLHRRLLAVNSATPPGPCAPPGGCPSAEVAAAAPAPRARATPAHPAGFPLPRSVAAAPSAAAPLGLSCRRPAARRLFPADPAVAAAAPAPQSAPRCVRRRPRLRARCAGKSPLPPASPTRPPPRAGCPGNRPRLR